MPRLLSFDTRPVDGVARPVVQTAGVSGAGGGPPFFFASRSGDEVVVRGQALCQLGHRLPPRTADVPDGVFAGWSWDGRTLEVEHDRYGLYPLFYYSRGEEFAVAPSVVTLLREGAAPDLDPDALAVFLQLGFFIDDETPFKHIRAVPPSVRFAWDGKLDIGPHRDLGARLDIPRQEALQAYADLFRDAVRRRLPNAQVVVPLSGGRDSRHILLELCEAGVRPESCVTAIRYGGGNNDVEVASMLAHSLDLEHVVLERGPRLLAELRKNLATSFCADEHAWLMPLAEHLNGRPVTIYDGIAGDVLSASLFQKPAWLELYGKGRFVELAKTLVGKRRDGITALGGPEARRLADTALDRIAVELQRYADATNPCSMFFFWNRTRREIALAPFGLLAGVEPCFCPYLDHELFDFLTSLPPEITIDRTFHTDTIALAHPSAPKVPYAVANRRRAVASLATFGASVVWYGLRSRSRRHRMLALLAEQLTTGLSPRTGKRKRVSVDPDRLLYLLQLEDVRQAARV
jgi:asparagine synthase (glutamine-hydrolysing)